MCSMNLVPRWMDFALMAWADWVRGCGRWQGWGGGVDRIDEQNHGGKRTPGTHSDPVLAELIAILARGHGPHTRLHMQVLELKATERRVIVARYCGRPKLERSALDLAEESAMAAVPRGTRMSKKTVCLLDLVWSRGWDERTQEERKLMLMADVATTAGRSVSACEKALTRAKLRLLFKMEVERMIRRGEFTPDGRTYTQSELAELREKTEREGKRAA